MPNPLILLVCYPVIIQQNGDQITASLLGMLHIEAIESTRTLAVQSLKKRISDGELIFLDIDEKSAVSDLSGVYADDPTLSEIEEEIYRLRDAQKDLQ